MSTPLTQNILKQYVYPSVDFKHDYDQNLKSRCYEVIVIVIIKRLILKIISPHQQNGERNIKGLPRIIRPLIIITYTYSHHTTIHIFIP